MLLVVGQKLLGRAHVVLEQACKAGSLLCKFVLCSDEYTINEHNYSCKLALISHSIRWLIFTYFASFQHKEKEQNTSSPYWFMVVT